MFGLCNLLQSICGCNNLQMIQLLERYQVKVIAKTYRHKAICKSCGAEGSPNYIPKKNMSRTQYYIDVNPMVNTWNKLMGLPTEDDVENIHFLCLAHGLSYLLQNVDWQLEEIHTLFNSSYHP